MVLGKGALARQRGHDRRFEQFRQILQLLPGLAVMHTLSGDDDRALRLDQRRGDPGDRLRIGAALQARRLLILDRPAQFLAQQVGRKLDQHRRRPAVLDLREGAAQRLFGGARHRHLLDPFGDVAEIEGRVEVRANLVDVAGIPGRQDDDRAGIAKGLRDAAKGILGAGAVLHRKDADAVTRGDFGDRVAHMQADALLAHHDRADVGLRRGLDDRVDRIADQKLDALALQDFGDGVGDLHGILLAFSGRGAIVTQPGVRLRILSRRPGFGQLGDGTADDRHTPIPVPLSGVAALAAGFAHSLGVTTDHMVWAWGWNSNGQLGDGTTEERHSPVQVQNLSGVTAVAGGGQQSRALKGDGTVWAWGRNDIGQLGDGTTIDRHTPVQVQNLSEVKAIAAGQGHNLALKSDGTVWAWGENGAGQLGDGTTMERHTPVQVRNLSGVTAVASGAEYSLVLKSDGTVWAWGSNGLGQLGDGTNTDRHAPVRVISLSGVTGI